MEGCLAFRSAVLQTYRAPSTNVRELVSSGARGAQDNPKSRLRHLREIVGNVKRLPG